MNNRDWIVFDRAVIKSFAEEYCLDSEYFCRCLNNSRSSGNDSNVNKYT